MRNKIMELTNEEKAEILWAIQEWNLPSWEEMGFEYTACGFHGHWQHPIYVELETKEDDGHNELNPFAFREQQEVFILLLIRLAMDLSSDTFKVASIDRTSGEVEVTDKGAEWVKELLEDNESKQ